MEREKIALIIILKLSHCLLVSIYYTSSSRNMEHSMIKLTIVIYIGCHTNSHNLEMYNFIIISPSVVPTKENKLTLKPTENVLDLWKVSNAKKDEK